MAVQQPNIFEEGLLKNIANKLSSFHVKYPCFIYMKKYGFRQNWALRALTWTWTDKSCVYHCVTPKQVQLIVQFFKAAVSTYSLTWTNQNVLGNVKNFTKEKVSTRISSNNLGNSFLGEVLCI